MRGHMETARKILPACIDQDKLDAFLCGGSTGVGLVNVAKFKQLTAFPQLCIQFKNCSA